MALLNTVCLQNEYHTNFFGSSNTYTHTVPRSPGKVARGKMEVKKEAPESPTKLKPSLMDPVSVRANAKRALYQILWKRYDVLSLVPFYAVGE